VIGFTLGNISVEGTYTTHVLNLTPRGLLLVTAAAKPLSCAAKLLPVPYSFSRWVGYHIGGLPLVHILPVDLIISLTAASC